MNKKSRFVLGDIDNCTYIYDSSEDITYFKEPVEDFESLVLLLNNMNRELDYYKVVLFGVELMSRKTGTIVTATEERFKCKYNFPNYVMDTENTYGSYSKLLSIKECCIVMNKLHNENIALLKLLNGEENDISGDE